jgi:hypothetical protein
LKSISQVQTAENARFEAKSATRKRYLAFLFEKINALKLQSKPEKARLQTARRESFNHSSLLEL